MSKVIPSDEILYRDQFGELCTFREYKIAVEVGVDQAVFAAQFMRDWEGTDLYLVDPYRPYSEMLGDRQADIMVAVHAMMPFHGRFKFIMLSSMKALIDLPKWVRPEFVYLDASHDYQDVLNDLDGWWGRLEPHGMLAGHDYDATHPGVIRAVNEFARKHDLTVRLTVRDALPSWYIYKTEPEKLF